MGNFSSIVVSESLLQVYFPLSQNLIRAKLSECLTGWARQRAHDFGWDRHFAEQFFYPFNKNSQWQTLYLKRVNTSGQREKSMEFGKSPTLYKRRVFWQIHPTPHQQRQIPPEWEFVLRDELHIGSI